MVWSLILGRDAIKPAPAVNFPVNRFGSRLAI